MWPWAPKEASNCTCTEHSSLGEWHPAQRLRLDHRCLPHILSNQQDIESQHFISTFEVPYMTLACHSVRSVGQYEARGLASANVMPKCEKRISAHPSPDHLNSAELSAAPCT